MIPLLFAIALFMGGNANGVTPPSPASHMTLGGVGRAAAALPVAVGEPSPWLAFSAVAAVLSVVGGVLVFIRRESRMKEPTPERTVTGGPISVRTEKDHVERHEHDGLKVNLQKQLDDIWRVISELRTEMGRMQTGLGEQTVLREANGEQLAEMRRELKAQSDMLHEVLGMMKAQKVIRH